VHLTRAWLCGYSTSPIIGPIEYGLLRGFHSDNGSEFVNKTVAALLNKLLIRFTKSRARHINDNGLVESKNGFVVRKQLGYAYIPQRCAELINEFNRDFFNPYINFHRPCFFPVTVSDHKGKSKKTYPYEEVRTPYERLGVTCIPA